MKNQPMSSSDQGKLLIFSLLMAPSIVFLLGVIPAIFLAFGIYMMKKNQDFSSIDSAVKNFKGYLWLGLIACTLIGFFHLSEFFFYTNDIGGLVEDLVITLIFAITAFAYLVAVQLLFYSPLKRHNEWVSVNGIFSKEPRSNKDARDSSEIKIVKGEGIKQYSVADELIKWAKLKEDGHISEDEFIEARAKLLKRN